MTDDTNKTWLICDGLTGDIVPFGPHLLLGEVDLGTHDTPEKQIQAVRRNGVALMDYFNPIMNDCACATCRHVEEVVLAFEDAREASCQIDSKDDCYCVVCHFNKTNTDPELKVFRVGEDFPSAKHVYAAFITENGGYNPRLHSVFADEEKAVQWLRQKPWVIGIDESSAWYIECWKVSE